MKKENILKIAMEQKSMKNLKRGRELMKEKNLHLVIVTFVKSFNDFKYIYKKYDSKIKKNKIPCQAVCNKLGIGLLPEEFRTI